jgi:hypothetical protein
MTDDIERPERQRITHAVVPNTLPRQVSEYWLHVDNETGTEYRLDYEAIDRTLHVIVHEDGFETTRTLCIEVVPGDDGISMMDIVPIRPRGVRPWNFVGWSSNDKWTMWKRPIGTPYETDIPERIRQLIAKAPAYRRTRRPVPPPINEIEAIREWQDRERRERQR